MRGGGSEQSKSRWLARHLHATSSEVASFYLSETWLRRRKPAREIARRRAPSTPEREFPRVLARDAVRCLATNRESVGPGDDFKAQKREAIRQTPGADDCKSNVNFTNRAFHNHLGSPSMRYDHLSRIDVRRVSTHRVSPPECGAPDGGKTVHLAQRRMAGGTPIAAANRVMRRQRGDARESRFGHERL